MSIEDRLRALEQLVGKVDRKRIGQQDILPGSIEQRHIKGNIIFTGLAANRPTNGSTGVIVYFATDTFSLSIWAGTAWKSTTLT